MALPTWPVTTALLTNSAYGNYGGRVKGATRRVAPKLLMCIHITAGSETATNAATHAKVERDYANRAGSGGPSAHDYIGRDGKVIHAIDETKYAAWSNGDLQTPNTALALVKTILAEKAKGYNPNELFVREVECCGYPGTFPVNAAQLETVARMIAHDSVRTGIPISRATVGTHADINSVTRARCAFPPTSRETKLAGVIARAKAIVAESTAPTYTQAQLDAAVAAAVAAEKARCQAVSDAALLASFNDGVTAASNAALTARKS